MHHFFVQPQFALVRIHTIAEMTAAIGGEAWHRYSQLSMLEQLNVIDSHNADVALHQQRQAEFAIEQAAREAAR